MSDHDSEHRKALEKHVEDIARETIGNLENGKVGSKTVRDLGDAVKRATRDSLVGRATQTGRS